MQPGDTFGRYEVEQALGRGGMGVVHLALDTRMQRRVALKVMSQQLAEDAEGLARFHREAETLARLDSPHIVTIFDHGDVDGTPYLAMQHVAGGDLGTQLKQRGPVPTAMAAAICAQVAEALHDAHSAGIVHRDVKPANVLVRDPDAAEPFVYLGDFGIAQAQSGEGLTRAGSVAGSWAYLAPERAHGAPATPASDVYALGCLLHACLTGRAPYAGSDVEMAVAHVNEPVPQLPGTDEATVEVNRILARAMAKDPADRYATAGELRSDLLALSRGTHDSGASPVPSTPTPDPGGAHVPAPTSGSPSGSASGSVPGSVSDTRTGTGRRTGRIAAIAAAVLVVVVGGTLGVRALGGDDDTTATPDGAGTPAEAVEDPVAGDWDGDGLGDVRVGRTVFRDGFEPLPVVLLASDGSALGEAAEDIGTIERPKTGDVDGDGRPDLVQFEASEDETEVTATVWRGTGDGVDEPTRHTFRWRTDYGFYGVGDFDGDGRSDLLMTRNRGEKFMVVAVARSTGDGFEDPVEFAARGGRANEDDLFAIGDFDGDGRDDLAAQVFNGGDAVGVRFRVLLSTGERFRKTPTTRIEDGRYGVADFTAADIDGDGDDELVHLITDRWGEDEYGATVAVQRFVNGTFGTPEELVAPTSGGPDIPYLDVAASDVDGDGDEDVVRLHSYDDESGTALVEVHLADGGTLQEPVAWGEVPCTTDGCESESASLVDNE